MKFNITDSDIKKGVIRDVNGCAIARSVKRTLKANGIKVKNIDISVNTTSIEICQYGNALPSVVVDLPKHASEFVVKFDNEEEVKPFTLTTRNIVKELATV
jgi:hypothetical protein